MWAQLITMRLKADRVGDLETLTEQLAAAEQPGSGLIRSTTMQDQHDPAKVYVLVVFESEEAARARESDERRANNLASIRELMAEIFEGPPEFVDLEVAKDFVA